MPASTRTAPRLKSRTPSSKAPATDVLDGSIAYSLRRAQLSTYPGFLEAMSALDIRPAQYAVLVLIRTNPGLSQSAISDALNIQKANFVALLDKLEERGLTARHKVPVDRRASALHLTPQGEAFLKRVEKAHGAFEKSLTARLGPKRSKQLLHLLHEFSAGSHG